MSNLPGVERSRPLAIGSLCTGYGGLDLGVDAVLDGELSWYSEIDDLPASVMAHHRPEVPNLGDLTVLDWASVPAIDVLTAGYPCQPFSNAGQRKGADDERHLWPYIAEAVRVLRPRLVVLENVAGHVSLGLGGVLGDLAEAGFDAEWCVVRASDVGACHQRARLFLVAADPDQCSRARRESEQVRGTVTRAAAAGVGEDVPSDAGSGQLQRRRVGGLVGAPASGAEGEAPEWERVRDSAGDGGEDAADADLDGCSLERGGELGAGEGTWAHADGRAVAWGDYGPAIERHAIVVGRWPPSPVDDGGRLSPAFVEWMMMLPEGWVTGVVERRSSALRILGNGVVPPQASYAIGELLAELALDRLVAA